LDSLLAESKRLGELGKDAGYESFIRLVEMRDQLVQAISGYELTDEQKRKLLELQAHDAVLLRHMNELKREAEKGLQSIRNSRIQQQAYQSNTPYESMLFDKKR